MTLDEIQEMWQRDSVIDPDNLHDESLKIPQLHSKYYTLYNTITLLREKARETHNRVRLERYNYYTGKATAEVYAEEPFPYKVREKDAIQRHMDADERLSKIDLKLSRSSWDSWRSEKIVLQLPRMLVTIWRAIPQFIK